MKFEWDEHKAAINYDLHHVRFVDAIKVFDDDYAIEFVD